MARQSVPRTAHPKVLRLQFPTEPRFLRLNHEACSFPFECDANFHVWLRHLSRGAACCAPTRQSILLAERPIRQTQTCRAIEVSKTSEPAERFAGRSPARHRQKQF